MNKRNYGILGGIIAIFAVIAVISIAYAGLSTNLQINGTGTVNKSSWRVLFTNVSDATKTGTATEVTHPEIVANSEGVPSTKVGDYAVTMTTPGDSVSYIISVKNEGSFDAYISNLNIPTPTITGSGTTASTDVANVTNYISYTLTYADGTALNVNDALDSGETKQLKLTLTYLSTIPSNKLPANDITISGLATSITYAQK